MTIDLIRYKLTDKRTFGLLFIDGDFFCYTMEDVDREGEEKVKGKTAIWHDLKYIVQFRKVDSPLTLKYRKRFDWFTYHIEIIEVYMFRHVYFHVGNDEYDTDGCVLLGYEAREDRITKSVEAFKDFYERVGAALEAGEPVELNVKRYFTWDIVL